jgi:hypothetical protein
LTAPRKGSLPAWAETPLPRCGIKKERLGAKPRARSGVSRMRPSSKTAGREQVSRFFPGSPNNSVRAARSAAVRRFAQRGMVPSPTPKRDHGDPQAFRLRSEGKGRPVWTGMITWCGRRDLNPHGPCGPTDFHTLLRLSPPLLSARVWGLDYPFTVPGFGSGCQVLPV